MSTLTKRTPISLKKAEERAIISLKKRDVLDPPTVAVGLALDISGSTVPYYRSGAMSDIVTRILALAKQFDDNSEMDMWIFDTDVKKLDNATVDNYESYVDDNIMDSIGGGTTYHPAIKEMYNFYFPPSKTDKEPSFFNKLFGSKKISTETPTTVIPAFAIFLTDGETGSEDMARTRRVFEESSANPIYWLLVGVGKKNNFAYLEKAAKDYPNVGFLSFADLDMDDDTLYDGIVSQEFVTWLTRK